MASGCWIAGLAMCGVAVAQPLVPSSGDNWKLHMEAGRALENSGHFADAKDQFQAALRIPGAPKDARGFAARIELGTVTASMGQYLEAEEWDNEAVRLGLELYGKDRPELALPFINLAALYRDQGDGSRAEELGRRALSLIGDSTAIPPATRADVLGTLGGILSHQGKLSEAEVQLEESIQIAKSLSPRSDILGGDWNNLADVYAKTGRLTEALAAYQAADDLCGRSGANDSCHFFTHAGIAAVRAASGNYTEAVSAMEQGIQAADSAGAGNTLQVRDALAAEATWLHKLKRNQEAKRVRAREKQVAQAAAHNSYSQSTVDAREAGQSLRSAPE